MASNNEILQTSSFTSNYENKIFYTTLIENLKNCSEFKICVSFIRKSGAQLLVDILKELDEKGIKGEILTSTYMNVTQPDALVMLGSFKNIKIKIYQTDYKNGFHAKGYLFYQNSTDEENWTIIIGSSNISDAAFKTNIEWNVVTKESFSGDHEPGDYSISILKEFEDLWKSPYSKDLSDEFLISYREYLAKIKQIQKANKEIFSFEEECIKPNLMQTEAITKLSKLRSMNENKALAIAATGTGKTYMSVFDAMQYNPQKLLFIVHREDILVKAKQSFDQVLSKIVKNYSSGFFTGTKKNLNCKYLFATEQSIASHTTDFSPTEFDYIVIDEAHHAADNSYQKIIDYFKPKFLLGLTATPERSDGKDIFEFFDFNRAINIRLRDSLEKDLVCPFHYFGITEVEGIDYNLLKHSPDEDGYLDEVASMLMKSKRVNYILEKIDFYKYDGDEPKALGFCATVDHAKFMANEFNKILGEGTAIALSGDDSISFRTECIKRLESDGDKLQYIFTRDIFNEGIDIQNVNLILMLRPTQSSIVFTQQLGRGLRKVKNKEFVTILDFIGNYQKSFLVSSVFSKETNPDKKTRLREVDSDYIDIPGNTFIHFDKVVKEQILRQIDAEKFMSDENLKKAYFVFRKDNGDKMPYLTDFLKHFSEIDPTLFSKIKKGNLLYHSYFEFVVNAENEFYSKQNLLPNELIQLNKIAQNEIFSTFLKFLTTFLPAKRIEEWCILKCLFNNPQKSFSIEELLMHIKKYVDYQNQETMIYACRFLSGDFLDSKEKLLYEKIKINFIKNEISLNQNLQNLLLSKDENSLLMQKWISDYIEYAILRYDTEFCRDDFGFPFFKPYAKYSMKNTALLCKYEKTTSSFRGSGLLTNAKPEYLIFVDLYKADNIEENLNYADKFITHNLFQWQSPNNKKQSDEVMQNVINNVERKIHLHLFIRKFKEIENIPQDYTYFGQVISIPESAVGNNPVTLNFAIPEVPDSIYYDFTTQVDKTKIKN